MTQFSQLPNQDDKTKPSSDLQWFRTWRPSFCSLAWAVLMLEEMPVKRRGIKTSNYSSLSQTDSSHQDTSLECKLKASSRKQWDAVKSRPGKTLYWLATGPSQTQLRRTHRGCHTPSTEMMADGLGPKWKKGVICTALTTWSKSNPATTCTQQTSSSLEKVLKGPRASGTMENLSRLDQLRPLQFHTRCCTGDVLASTQDLYNRFLKATRVQVRSTAALPQWPTRKWVPAVLLPMLPVVETQAWFVCFT